jgi:uncharacterized protein DUF4304
METPLPVQGVRTPAKVRLPTALMEPHDAVNARANKSQTSRGQSAEGIVGLFDLAGFRVSVVVDLGSPAVFILIKLNPNSVEHGPQGCYVLIMEIPVKKIVNDELTKLGFKKRGLNWYQHHKEVIHVVALQKSASGNSYYINLAVWVNELGSSEQPKCRECHLQVRLAGIDGSPNNITPHERPLQPLHDRQDARLPQASWPCRVDPHRPPPQRRTLSEGAFRSGPPLRRQTHPSRCPREAQKAPPCMLGGKVHDRHPKLQRVKRRPGTGGASVCILSLRRGYRERGGGCGRKCIQGA